MFSIEEEKREKEDAAGQENYGRYQKVSRYLPRIHCRNLSGVRPIRVLIDVERWQQA